MNSSILNVLIITALLMLVYSSFSFKENSYHFLSMQHTNVIKGIAILTVIWGHSTKELGVNHIQFIAAVGVFLFLFCSGYGCYLSYLKKGLKGYWKRKILKIFIPFWVIEFIGLNINGNFEWVMYLQDCIFLKPATAYGWFMGFLVVYYLLFWISCRLKKRMQWKNQIILYIMIIVSMIWLILDSVFWASPFMPELKARQMMAFPIGILFAMKKKVYISPRITKQEIGRGILAIIIGGGLTLLAEICTNRVPYVITDIISMVSIIILGKCVIYFSYKISWIRSNKALEKTGEWSFMLYMVHAFTLQILNDKWYSTLIFLLSTYIIAYTIYTFVYKKIQNAV